MIRFCIALKLQTSSSFRAIEKSIAAMSVYLNISFNAPSHSTILLWIKKYGHYQLNQPQTPGKDWVIILDESVQFGQNKLLVVYGLRQSQVDFSRPLTFNDLTPLLLSSKSSWSGKDIQQQLTNVQSHIGEIKYAVADLGSPIKKALELSGIPHVYDLTHRISLIVEHLYSEASDFKEYTKQMAHQRHTQSLGKMSHLLPPKQRVKARFMNLRPISDWGMAVLRLLKDQEEACQEEKRNLAWVHAHRDLIKELDFLNTMINDVQEILKTRGISKQSIGRCNDIFKQAKTARLKEFGNKMNQYLQQTLTTVSGIDKVMCCSDIIESSFGKYKNYLQDNPMVGITNLSLSVAAFTGSLNKSEIKDACENTTVNNIEDWTRLNIGKTTLAKRGEVLKMGRN